MKSQNDQPECDICSQCGEHAEYIDGLSNCCGEPPLNVEVDLEDRRSFMSLSRAAVMIFAAVVSVGCASAPKVDTSTTDSKTVIHVIRWETPGEAEKRIFAPPTEEEIEAAKREIERNREAAGE